MNRLARLDFRPRMTAIPINSVREPVPAQAVESTVDASRPVVVLLPKRGPKPGSPKARVVAERAYRVALDQLQQRLEGQELTETQRLVAKLRIDQRQPARWIATKVGASPSAVRDWSYGYSEPGPERMAKLRELAK